MIQLKTQLNPGDSVWWVHEHGPGGRVCKFQGTIERIELCEYQGALYCVIDCPSFKRNPMPVVHYSFVFADKDEAEQFRQTIKLLKDKNFKVGNTEFTTTVYPKCFGCYHQYKNRRKEGC